MQTPVAFRLGSLMATCWWCSYACIMELSEELAKSQARVAELEKMVGVPCRRRLPEVRSGLTHKFDVAGHEGYVNVGLFEDGTPGEMFITMAKEGSTIGGLMDTVARMTSLALQYGVPVDVLADKFIGQRFEPAGWTQNPKITPATSIPDYIFRWLKMEFGSESARHRQLVTVEQVRPVAIPASEMELVEAGGS